MAPAATRDNPGANNWTCSLCGHDRQVIATRGPDYEYSCAPGPFVLAQCLRCGHVSLDPIPPSEEVAALYPPTYYTVSPASPLYLKGFIYKHKIRGDVKRIRSYMDVRLLRSVVDIGSGDAARLFELRRVVPHEVECIALDLSFPPAMVERARAERITLVQGNIELDLHMLQNGAHDLIIMSQILEHLRDPIVALESLKSKLAPGGFLLLETPNRGGLDYLLFRKRYWGGYHLPRHFHLFTKASLVQTAKRVGYRVERQGSLPSPGFWIMSLRNALGLNSRLRGNSVFEFLNFSNLLAVGTFTALDLFCIVLGISTSNQFVLLARD